MMDSKGLAKSKRAHSLHHSKKQPNKPKAASGSVSNAGPVNKNIGKQARERARQSGLPTNWDRYEDEFDSASGESSVNKESDVVLPKSKGADYRYLIAEAQSQCQSNCYGDSPSLVDDVLLGDLRIGLGPMLSVRGEGILSWIEDDNFVEEDEAAVNSEAHFLSLNLNALAEQLAKVDISKRLFIEEDLLPPELSDHGMKATSSPESDQMQISKNQIASTVSKQTASKDSSGMLEAAKQSSEVTTTMSSDYDIKNQTKDALYSSRDNFTGNRALESNASPITDRNKKQSMFEATSVEAELDMLLDSFNKTELQNSSAFVSTTHPLSDKEASRGQPQQAQNIPSSAKTQSTAINLDDALDDLLEETSNLSNHSNPYHSTTVKAPDSKIQPPPSSQSVTKSKVLDDFDSWFDTL